MTRQQKLWILLTIISTILWGIAGLFAKQIFLSAPKITPMLLTQIRMIIGGTILLIFSAIRKENTLAIWHNKKDAVTVTAYGLAGMIPVQFCYYKAIQLGDASIATILQFVGPFFIIFYLALFRRQKPSRIEVISTIIAFLGVIILATHGDLTQFAITPAILIWGLLSAVGSASSALIPQSLLDKYSAIAVTGWGLITAGIGLIILQPTFVSIDLNLETILLLLGVIVLGTVIPFYLFTNALKYISATTASMLDAFEPISATVGSIIFFGLTLSSFDLLGSLLVIGAVLLLNWQPKRPKFESESK